MAKLLILFLVVGCAHSKEIEHKSDIVETSSVKTVKQNDAKTVTVQKIHTVYIKGPVRYIPAYVDPAKVWHPPEFDRGPSTTTTDTGINTGTVDKGKIDTGTQLKTESHWWDKLKEKSKWGPSWIAWIGIGSGITVGAGLLWRFRRLWL